MPGRGGHLTPLSNPLGPVGAGRGGAGLRQAWPLPRAPGQLRPFPIGSARGPRHWRAPASLSLGSGPFRRRARRPRSRCGEAASPGANKRSARRGPLPRRPGARSGRLRRPRGGAGHTAEHLCLRPLFVQPRLGAGPGRRPVVSLTKRNWGARVLGDGQAVSFSAGSLGFAAPGSEMSKPPPKPVKPAR
ncbi:osteoclast-stimulating factor 1 isoform X3 [Trachypithecus francoisi]|uniref:osteoclast-stimulating factor 1 isoform X3 n=1 Tax=Trachypithecus francoisi TaxID=54180 RepID=UPI00141A9508|nr:osteoclast-stimulating factor 1 isoform X3 [Trachypithecus francoisi]